MHGLFDIVYNQRLISIAGKSGTGKTTLALQLVGEMLTPHNSFSGSCVWIQASETFPKKRLFALYKDDKKRLAYLSQKIWTVPSGSNFVSYPDQSKYLEQFSKKLFPKYVKLIVIDNISHHLRYYLSSLTDISLHSKSVDLFYTTQLFPLVMRCFQDKITLILIHEVSFDPKSGRNRIFKWKLFERLKACTIFMENRINGQKQLSVAIDNRIQSIPYIIENSGLHF